MNREKASPQRLVVVTNEKVTYYGWIPHSEADLVRGEPGYCEFVVGLAAKCGCCPSRDGALGVIGVSGSVSLTDNNKYI